MSSVVVVEHRDGTAIPTYAEAVAAARSLGEPVVAVVVGAHAEAIAATVTGVDEIVAVRTPTPEHEVDREVAAIVAVARDRSAWAIVAVNTATALGWAAAVAVKLDAGYAADVVELSATGDGLRAARGLYGGKLLADLELSTGSVVLVRPSTFSLDAAGSTAPVTVIDRDDPSRTSHRAYREKATDEVDIGEAPFLLAIGRGVGDRENIDEFEQLAVTMGATLAVSRPLVDAGWMSDARQVGQSGKTVAPRVYLAFGISGAVQHLAGMKGADTIIAVNTDPSAAIFGVAHYGTTVDMFDVAEALADAWSG
jgi:electron transfer flavoprotein alpha subunit